MTAFASMCSTFAVETVNELSTVDRVPAKDDSELWANRTEVKHSDPMSCVTLQRGPLLLRGQRRRPYIKSDRWRMLQRVVDRAVMYGLFDAFAMLFVHGCG